MMYRYTKINGNGNNFLILDNRTLKLGDEEKSKLTLRDCNVNSSIGADGILFVEHSDCADFAMRIFNADGSEAEMCGNGARCIAQYGFDNDIASAKMCFETKAGLMKAEIISGKVDLDMGIVDMSTLKINDVLDLSGRKIIYSYLLLGVPHVVIYCEENQISTREEMLEIGGSLSKLYRFFPDGTNVNFVNLKDSATIQSVTYERGVNNLTDSCGTGSCASAVISGIAKDLNKEIAVENPGGTNVVRYNFSEDKMLCHVILRGDVKSVAHIQMLM